MASLKGELDSGAGTESTRGTVPVVSLSSDVRESGLERIMSLFQRRLANDEARTLISQLLCFFSCPIFFNYMYIFREDLTYFTHPFFQFACMHYK